MASTLGSEGEASCSITSRLRECKCYYATMPTPLSPSRPPGAGSSAGTRRAHRRWQPARQRQPHTAAHAPRRGRRGDAYLDHSMVAGCPLLSPTFSEFVYRESAAAWRGQAQAQAHGAACCWCCCNCSRGRHSRRRTRSRSNAIAIYGIGPWTWLLPSREKDREEEEGFFKANVVN